MKKFFAVLICASIILSAHAQKTATKPTTSKTTTTTSANVLKTENDSLSYAIGLSVANFYKQQGIKLSNTLVTKALNDISSGKKPLLTDEEANLVFMCHSNPQLCSYVKEQEKFLADNKKRPGVRTTASGLQYEVITQGTGTRPTVADTFVVNYKGTLTNGTEFDNSYSRGTPLVMAMSDVVKGWTEALELMPVGSKYKVYIPYQLGYGLNGSGPIPGGSVLVFEMELLDVKKR